MAKEDGAAVVIEVAEASGGGLDSLNGRVEAFGHAVGDLVVDLVGQALKKAKPKTLLKI